MGERNDLIERLRDKLPGIQTPMMNGDNLAITLCSHFDNPNQPEDEFGWSKDAVRGQYEVLDAIHAHYATTIASLSEALAEAEKKGAEDFAELCDVMADEDDVLAMREGLEDWEIFQHRHAERRLREAARRFRDLSQGGQHG